MSEIGDVKPNYKLQPVVLYIEQRLECDTCGALAVILSLREVGREDDGERILARNAYCQDCWHNFINEEDDE
jgi:hypothetical protein